MSAHLFSYIYIYSCTECCVGNGRCICNITERVFFLPNFTRFLFRRRGRFLFLPKRCRCCMNKFVTWYRTQCVSAFSSVGFGHNHLYVYVSSCFKGYVDISWLEMQFKGNVLKKMYISWRILYLYFDQKYTNITLQIAHDSRLHLVMAKAMKRPGTKFAVYTSYYKSSFLRLIAIHLSACLSVHPSCLRALVGKNFLENWREVEEREKERKKGEERKTAWVVGLERRASETYFLSPPPNLAGWSMAGLADSAPSVHMNTSTYLPAAPLLVQLLS